MSYFINKKNEPNDEWTTVNLNTLKSPKPDMENIQAKKCFTCNSEQLELVSKIISTGGIQFKARCLKCGNKSGAIPFARDLDSISHTVFPFGKHRGKSLGQLAKEAPGYLDWCLANLTDVKMLGTILLFERLSKLGK